MKLYERYEGKKLKLAEKIQRRRLQLLVHSYIYYELNDNIVTDAVWSKWAKELVELQERYPNMSKRIQYAHEFEGWDGSTGAFLQFDDATAERANRLLECRDRKQRAHDTSHTTPKKKSVQCRKRKLF